MNSGIKDLIIEIILFGGIVLLICCLILLKEFLKIKLLGNVCNFVFFLFVKDLGFG